MGTVRVTFHGAALTVTGSKFLVESEAGRILVDCGLFQGRKEWRLRNWDEPKFDIASLTGVVLTHAHIDHTGYLPLLARRGYKGPVYCTAATKALLGLLLPDSAHLQEEEARHANKHGTSKHHPAKPLYSSDDARAALSLLKIVERRERIELSPGFVMEMTCAGHILGSTSLSIETDGKRLTFSGDVGHYDTPILPDPEPHDLGDLLLCESTYGNRVHADVDHMAELERVVQEAVERGGPLIIPAFAVGRTQTVLYYLAQLEREGKIPVLPIFVDSPMAVDATDIYRTYRNDYDEESAALLAKGDMPLFTERTTFVRSVEQSKSLNDLKEPAIIVSASGMVNGGRILHHMIHWLDKETTTILFVGYQAEGTRGRKIESGAQDVKIFGRYVPIRARVETLSGFSAHGDRKELLRWLRSCSGTPSEVRVVHGEKEASYAFAKALQHEFAWDVRPAHYLETVEL